MTREMWAADAATRLRDELAVAGPVDWLRVPLDDLRALLDAARCEEEAPQYGDDDELIEDPDHVYRCHRLRTHTDADPQSSHVWEARITVPGRPRLEWRA